MAKKKAAARGGFREGAGRRSHFDTNDLTAMQIRLTRTGLGKLVSGVERLNGTRPAGALEVSRNAFIEALLRKFGDALNIRAFQGEADTWQSEK